MKQKLMIVGLLATLSAVAFSDELTVKLSHDSPAEVVAVSESRAFTLEDAVYDGIDHDDRGNVVLLNNGSIVLQHTEPAEIEDVGEIRVPTEFAIVQLNKPVDVEGDLYAVLSYEDVYFDISWDEDGAGGFLTIWDEDRSVQLQLGNQTLNGKGGPSCEVTCGGGSCSTSCPQGKACIAYCNGNTPVCSCVTPPKKKDFDDVPAPADPHGIDR